MVCGSLKTGSLEQPLSLTPFVVDSIRKCRTKLASKSSEKELAGVLWPQEIVQ